MKLRRGIVLCCALAPFLNTVGFGQVCPPGIQWQQSFGGSDADWPYTIIQCRDGGYAIGGSSTSWANGTKTSTNFGYIDFWLVRLDRDGRVLWDRSYGGDQGDVMKDLEETSDGGFILGGVTASGVSGSKTTPSLSAPGYLDYWAVRVDAQGNQLWDGTFGGISGDELYGVQQTSDGGFILGGWSHCHIGCGGSRTSPDNGSYDFWIVKLDGDGHRLWDRAYGGRGSDTLYTLRQTLDGGFILGGYTCCTFDNNVDFYVVRIDAEGNELWNKTYGGFSEEVLWDLDVMPDGGFILAGTSGGSSWIVRIDALGNVVWERSFAGGSAFSVRRTHDGGAIVGGTSNTPRFGFADMWVIRLDANGFPMWEQVYGGTGSDGGANVLQTQDRGFILAGGSSSEISGNKTSPHIGNGDFWVVKLAPETPDDCDVDGVPNEHDRCPDTPAGAIVNADGCTIDQLCPCEGWETHDAYVDCVRDAVADFHRAGLITSAQRHQIIQNALAANCPLPPGPEQIVFGLPHRAIGGAVLQTDYGYLGVENPQRGTVYGISVALGRADSGIFIYPSAGANDYNDAWFLNGKAYGRLNGRDQALISTIHGTKPNYETYPVHIDLSGLAPESLTFQVFWKGRLVDEGTVSGASGSFTVHASEYREPRANPFWRMPDGSVGALIELNLDNVAEGHGCGFINIEGPFGDTCGDQIFIRANNPAHDVEYVSKFDVTASPALHAFYILDERLGVFNHPNKALGPVRMDASAGRLNVTALEPLHYEKAGGVLVEAPRNSRLEIDLLPLQFRAPAASPQVSGSAFLRDGYGPQNFVNAHFTPNQSGLHLQCDFYGLFADEPEPTNAPVLEVKAFRNGILTGSMVVSNQAVAGVLAQRNHHLPEFLGLTAMIESNGVPSLGFSVKQVATFTAANGTELTGNHLRFTLLAPPRPVRALSHLALLVNDDSRLTITGERSRIIPPALNITSSAPENIALSWPDNTRLYILESAPTLDGPFEPVTDEIQFVDDRNNISIPLDPTGQRFFRVHLPLP